MKQQSSSLETRSSDSASDIEPIIQLRNLNIGYTKSLVKDITAEIYPGDRIEVPERLI